MKIHMNEPLLQGGMETAIGIILLLFGLPAAIWPYKVSRFEEAIDAIGSKRDSFEVEPADWKVTLNRYGGVIMTILGVVVLLMG